MSPSSNWEYRLLHLTTSHEIKNVEDALNDMGRQGWELITAYPHFDNKQIEVAERIVYLDGRWNFTELSISKLIAVARQIIRERVEGRS